ncbi:MAG: hypothetical protein GF311_12070 [Candidatus Lokiarchaeota archaeon]|nr:hypothetical protein [Candidatus Lokiarchaeota archaeon]
MKIRFDCDQIYEAPLDDKDEFDLFIQDIFKSEEKEFNEQKLDSILSKMIQTPLNKKIERNGVPLFFLGYKKIRQIGEKFEYLFRFKTTCSRCEKEFTFEQKIIYYAEKYLSDPSYFEVPCPNCSLTFHMDAYINEWWFD